MALPEPRPGLVLRYDYLWRHEAAAGQDRGKDRPTGLVAATDALVRPRYVVLLPITHTPPSGDTVCFGSTVTIERKGRTQTFRIVGVDEADPARGLISFRSPLVAAVMGARAGDMIEAGEPLGDITIRSAENA